MRQLQADEHIAVGVGAEALTMRADERLAGGREVLVEAGEMPPDGGHRSLVAVQVLQHPLGARVEGIELVERCAEAFDYNNDNRDDLIACRLKGQTPKVYRNNGGSSFTEVSSSLGLTQTLADAVPVDLNGDGWQDLVIAELIVSEAR